MPNLYTPENITAVKKSIAARSLSRPDAVKLVRDHFHLGDRQARDVYRKYFEGTSVPNQTAAATPAASEEKLPDSKGAHMSFKGDTGEIDLVDESPRTLEDLLRACRVDLNIWEVEKYVVNKWEMGRADKQVNLTWKDGRADGYVRDGGQVRKAPLWQVKAWLRKKVEESTIAKALESFVERANKHAPVKFAYEKIKRGKTDCCYVLNIQDLHLAKLAWSEETGGADWDIRISEQAFRDAVDELINKAPVDRIEEVIVIAGSDMLQVDNDKSATTAGTYVDSDTRFAKAFDVATKMLTDVIEKLASRFKVRCVTFAGNHDSTVSFFLGKYVDAWFRNHENVEVDSSPRSRKYVGFGKTLIAFDHGNNTKLKDLPLTIMRENQATISQYKYTEVLTGHLHREGVEDIKGIVVRTAPALCSPDAWHSTHGYIGTIRRSQGLLYQRDTGLEAIYYSTPLD